MTSFVYNPNTPKTTEMVNRILDYVRTLPETTVEELQAQFGLPKALLAKILRSNGLTPNYTYTETSKRYSERRAVISSLYTSDPTTTLDDLGNAFGVTRERIRQIVKQESSGFRKARNRIDAIAVAEAARNAISVWDCQKKLGGKYNYISIRNCLSELGMLPAVERLWRIRTKKANEKRLEQKIINAQQTRERLIRDLKAVALELGHTPGTLDLQGKDGRPWFSHYYRYFGSLTAAQKLAGLIPNRAGFDASPLPPGFSVD